MADIMRQKNLVGGSTVLKNALLGIGLKIKQYFAKIAVKLFRGLRMKF